MMKRNSIWMLALVMALLSCKGGKSGEQAVQTAPQTADGFYDASATAKKSQNTQKAKVVTMYEQPAPLKDRPEQILHKTGFTISYNRETKTPNWVAWHLTSSHTNGSFQRKQEIFQEDMEVKAPRATDNDYYNSRFDRGHMCPAGDNKNNEQAMNESFMMTNVCPQDHDLNSGWWNDLENKCREWACNEGDLYIVAGPIYDTPSPKRIGKRKNVRVSVPDRFFKVVLMMGESPKAIGFIVPNLDLHESLSKYAVPVDRVEKVTGLDFYPNLPDGLERRVERECKPADWKL